MPKFSVGHLIRYVSKRAALDFKSMELQDGMSRFRNFFFGPISFEEFLTQNSLIPTDIGQNESIQFVICPLCAG